MKKLFFLAFFFPFLNFAQPVTDGLIGHWPMGANPFDYSGKSNDGVLYGATPTEGRDREQNTAYNFNLNQHISIGDPPEYDFGSNEFSVSLWIYQTQTNSNWHNFLVGKWNVGSSAGTNEWAITSGTGANDDIPSFTIEIGNTSYNTNSTTEISLNKWHHLVAIRKAEAIELYIDGILVGNEVIPNSPINNINGRTLDFGAFYNNGNLYYLNNCKIDDAMIYNKALSPTEITTLYRDGSSLANSNLPNGLIGYWPMGANPFDYSGNGNDGVLTGVTATEGRDREPATAYAFDHNQYISLGDPAEYDFGAQEFSISTWIYRTQDATTWDNIILGKWTTSVSAGQNEWTLLAGHGTNGNYPSFAVEIGANYYGAASTEAIELNKWYHLTAIRKSTSIELYINGVLVANTAIPNVAINNVVNKELFFGKTDNGQNTVYLRDCKVDETMIFNKALSPEEITSLYRDGSPIAESNLPTGLIGYWPLGKNPFDYSGSGNDGRLIGALTPMEDQNGAESSAYFFKRGNTIDVGDVSEYDFGNNDFSISLWVNRAKRLNSYDKYLIGKWEADALPGENEWSLGLSNGDPSRYVSNKPAFRVEVGTATYTLEATEEIEKDKWYHIVATRKNDMMELYQNGILIANRSLPAGAVINEGGKDLLFGRVLRGTNPLLLDSVAMDEVMIFNKALSPTEIDELGEISPVEGSAASFANIHEDGEDVGIGTTDAHGYKLAVAGKVIAEEVKVALQANWPDYVFDAEYELKSLEEIQQFIEENKHLPGIPSAAKIEDGGISLGEMNAKLLKKIEELTLYQISLMHHIKGQDEHILKLQKELEDLEKVWFKK